MKKTILCFKNLHKNIPQYSLTRPSKPRSFWKNIGNVQEFLKEFKNKCNLETEENWNNITSKQLRLHGGRRLLDLYSLNELKSIGYPEGNFINNSSINNENLQKFLQELSKKLNLQTIDDWNQLKRNQIIIHGGNKYLEKYSLKEIKTIGFPDGKKLFSHSKKQWNDEKINSFLEYLKNNLNLNTQEDWNKLTAKQIKFYGGRRLLDLYSLNELKSLGYPKGEFLTKNDQLEVKNMLNQLKEKFSLENEEDWDLLTSYKIKQINDGHKLLKYYSVFEIKCLGFPDGKNFFKKPKKSSGFWKNKENILNFINNLKEKLNLNHPEDWNKLTSKQIIDCNGSRLLKLYSLFEIKSIGCPEGIHLFELKKSIKPPGYWDKSENIQKFLDFLKVKLNLNSPDDWNTLSTEQVKAFGGGSLLHSFSIFDLKCLGCPEGKSLFSLPYKPSGYWDNDENIQQFLEKVKQKFDLKTIDDWKRISKNQIMSLGGSRLLSKYSIQEIIKKQFPNENNFKITKNNISGNRSSQRWLYLQVQKLFPGEEIVEDYFHSELSRKTGYPVQFDVFLVDKNIAFEYHGQQHYEDIPAFAPTELYKKRDSEKEILCQEFGIQLIIVPYWWNNSVQTLKQILETQLKNFNQTEEKSTN